VASVLCSCLATHALLKYFHGIERQPMRAKRWGVYSHRVCAPGHPLLREINTRFDVPHSRHNDISRAALEQAGLTVLAESEDGGVHMAVSQDQFRMIYFQGHPEYDINSLLKEYKREILRYVSGEMDEPPPVPENYLPAGSALVVEKFMVQAMQAISRNEPVPGILENELGPVLDNTWGDTAKAIVNNWLGLVYQLTNLDRKKQFMSGVDPDDPLALKTGERL
jgi:homoserine O-succinyltransferase